MKIHLRCEPAVNVGTRVEMNLGLETRPLATVMADEIDQLCLNGLQV